MGCLILVAAGFVGVEILFRKRLNVLLGHSLHFLVVFLYHVLTAISSFAVALLTFVILFERLPNRPMHLRQAWPGALLTALLWETARLLFHHLSSLLQLPPGLRIDWRYGLSDDLGLYILSRYTFRSPGFAHTLRNPEGP